MRPRLLAAATLGPGGIAPDAMLADLAGRAARAACRAAGVAAADVDLVVTLSVSPSHQAVTPVLVGPRFGYAVQRDLGMARAFVLDLIDADWTFAIDQALLFARSQAARYVLVLRAENPVSIEAAHPAFAPGAGALLFEAGGQAPAARYAAIADGPLLTIEHPDDPAVRAEMVSHAWPPTLPDAGWALLADLPARRHVEGWVPGHAAPAFDVYGLARFLAEAPAGPIGAVTLDPFKARLGRIDLEVAR